MVGPYNNHGMSKKENLMDILHCEGVIGIGTRVETSAIENMAIYGFIPMDLEGDFLSDPGVGKVLDFDSTKTMIASDRIMVPYKVRIKRGYSSDYIWEEQFDVHPIIDEVHLQENNKEYKLPLYGLYLPQYRNDPRYKKYRSLVKPDNERVSNVGNLENVSIEEHTIREEEKEKIVKEAFYTPKPEELLFTSYRRDRIKALASSFCVVCRRLNTVTGNNQLELFKPEELYVVDNNK